MSDLQIVLRNPWVRVGLGLGALAGIAAAAYLLSFVLIPLFFAFLVAYVFDPVIDVFERRKVPRMRAIVVVVGSIMITALVLPVAIIPGMVIEAQQLIDGASRSAGDGLFDRALDRVPWEAVATELGWEAVEADENPRAYLAERLGLWIKENALSLIQHYAFDIANVGQRATFSIAELLRAVGGGLLAVVLTIGNFALFAFVAIYLLNDYDRIVAQAHDLVPPRHRVKVGNVMGRVDTQLRAFMRGQLMVCVCLGVMYCLGLWIFNVPFALFLGLFGGAVSVVPYLGFILTIGPALLFTLLAHGVDYHIAGVLATFVVAQTLESNFLTPRVVGSQVGLGPVWVILAVMVFGSTLGFVGMLLAVPIAAVIKVLAEEALAAYRASSFFAAPSGPAGEA